MLWAAIASSALLFVPYLGAKIAMFVIAAAVTYYILSFPTLKL
jgi:hypothetical protein